MPHELKEQQPVIHIESEHCWCEPIVWVNEDGEQFIFHRMDDKEDAS